MHKKQLSVRRRFSKGRKEAHGEYRDSRKDILSSIHDRMFLLCNCVTNLNDTNANEFLFLNTKLFLLSHTTRISWWWTQNLRRGPKSPFSLSFLALRAVTSHDFHSPFSFAFLFCSFSLARTFFFLRFTEKNWANLFQLCFDWVTRLWFFCVTNTTVAGSASKSYLIIFAYKKTKNFHFDLRCEQNPFGWLSFDRTLKKKSVEHNERGIALVWLISQCVSAYRFH